MSTILDEFRWCPHGCNFYHRRSDETGVHFAMVVYGPDAPNERNFPGTAEELARFTAALSVRAEERRVDDESFNSRIDAELERLGKGEAP